MIYTGNIVHKNRQKWGKKEHPVGLPRDVQYHWRMVRDSNPRTSCPVSGFQDRRIRPLCQPSKTFFTTVLSNRRFWSCANSVCSDLASQSRPSHSTAASNHPYTVLAKFIFQHTKCQIISFLLHNKK